MDFVNVILQPVVESLMVPVKKHIDFMTSCKKYVRDMGDRMGELKATRVDVEHDMKLNKGSNLEIPARVPGWLEEVKKVDAEVNNISSNVSNCFSFKTRHDVGKRAFELIQDIKRLTEERSRIIWTSRPIPLGEVDSMMVSASLASTEYHNDFESRKQTFIKALKALEPSHTSHMIALCGMGGVGKTTMMEKLKTIVAESRMFNLIVKAVIGEKTNPFAIQDAVADYIHIDLKERTIPARADKLRKWFKNYSEEGKKKILVILDDIWQLVDLNDIGLTTLPNQGIDFKVLLTSRSRDVCIKMGVEANSIFNVNVLAKAEAQDFFWKFLNDSGEANLDLDLLKLGNDIVRRCQGLPIAIKTIAYTLKGKSKDVWQDTLTRLQHHNIRKIVNEVFEVSYKNLEEEETKSAFLLCGLYPEDFDIPTEELVRYGWGLKLFNKVYTVRQARNRLNSCLEQLVNANLLIESNHVGSIKMHDLVRVFVLKMYSRAEYASIVNHGNMSEWPTNDTPDSYKRISLACNGIEEFPREFKYPNVSFLKLTNGDKSLRFPENFYGLMDKLQVIVYEKMQYPLLPGSFEYSTNLRTLCLDGCSLMFDCHSIGGLLNLEVLSFANCSIQKLPSTVGNLKELKLLDLTGCVNLHIEEGVIKNLVKLEELYMRVARKKAINFTDGNFIELAERSKYLSAIEIELFRNNAHLERMSFINLERFKISIGRFLEEKDEKMTSFENTLLLVSNKGELLESRINVLFKKTEVLYLEVDGMNDLEDFKCFSFHRLRVLIISGCEQLRYLFTRRVASTLSRLEHLEVRSCDTLQTLIHDKDSGSETIRFPSLKFLSLGDLPELAGLCNTGIVIELPQLMELQLDGLPDFTSIFPNVNLASSSTLSDTSTMQPFFNEKVGIPKLETLHIRRMNKLNKIWSGEVTSNEYVRFSTLKTINVKECKRLVNLFPRNPMPLLHHLKELFIYQCHSIKTIFKIDMGCVLETKEGSTSSLVSIVVSKSDNLRHVWSLKNVDISNNRIIYGFEAVESIRFSDCVNFRNLFTPITANFSLKSLQRLEMIYGYFSKSLFQFKRPSPQQPSSIESSPEQQTNVVSRNVAFSSDLIHKFHQLRTLTLGNDRVAKEVFDIESASSGELSTYQNDHHLLLPSLQNLTLKEMNSMSHVWKCNWNQFFSLEQPKSLCQNLTKIKLDDCRSIKYLFSPLMFKFLSNLKHVGIYTCEVMEEIVSSRDDKNGEMATSTSTHTNVAFSPILERLDLGWLKSLQHIGGGGVHYNSVYNQFQPEEEPTALLWSLCQYCRYIKISYCSALSSAIPSYALGHMQILEQLEIWNCDSMKDVFEIKRVKDMRSSREEGRSGDNSVVSLTTPKKLPNTTIMILPDLGNLMRLDIGGCPLLRDVFPFSTLKSLSRLKFLRIYKCNDIRVIVKEEEDVNCTSPSSSSGHQVVVFPCLKSMELSDLRNLECFSLGMNDFKWPVLKTVKIKGCPKMRMFTKGHSGAPMLKYLVTHLGVNSVERGLNNFFHPTQSFQKEVAYPTLDGSSSLPLSERTPWLYNNLIKVDVRDRHNQRFIIGHNELQHMQKIETLKISNCSGESGIFETFDMNNGSDHTHSVDLEAKQMYFWSLSYIKCLWKSKQWTVLKFPNLTRLSIHFCHSLKHVFTISMVGSLLQLQELDISHCSEMKIIVVEDEKEDENENDEEDEDEDDEEENDEEDEIEQNEDRKEDERTVNKYERKQKEGTDDERRVKSVEFPCLRSLTLDDLDSLKGFCLGKETVHWPSLDKLEIKNCPKLATFTNGQSTTPKLQLIDTSFGLCDATEGVNSFIRTKIEEGYKFANLEE